MLNNETLQFIEAHRDDVVSRLALTKVPQEVDMRMALQQIEGWQTARTKLPRWAETPGVMFPPRLSMEQCSSELTARYKCSIVQALLPQGRGDVMFDLTGGFGIDFSYLAPLFRQALYMERLPHLCELARHNFALMQGLHGAQVIECDSSQHPDRWPIADFCFVDPARRNDAGRKVVAIDDCEPNLILLQEALREHASFVLIKLSPMLDISVAMQALRHIGQVHAVSVHGECKELLLVMTREEPVNTTFHCVNFVQGEASVFSFTPADEQQAACVYASEVKTYLYEPNASVMKCGAYRAVAQRYGVEKLHPSSHLYTSHVLHADFPGRVFQVMGCSTFAKSELKSLLQGLSQANLTVRNFPQSVAWLRKRLKLKEGGADYLFATTMGADEHVLIRTRKPQ